MSMSCSFFMAYRNTITEGRQRWVSWTSILQVRLIGRWKYCSLSGTFHIPSNKIRIPLSWNTPIIALSYFSVLFLLYLQNLTEEEEIEPLFLESEIDLIQRDGLVVLEYDEETPSFPCRKRGHLFYSAEALESHDNTSHGKISVFPAEIAVKSSAKININFFMKGIA